MKNTFKTLVLIENSGP